MLLTAGVWTTYACGAILGAFLQVEDTLGKKVKGYTAGGAYTSGPWYIHLSWASNQFDQGGLLGAAYTSGLLIYHLKTPIWLSVPLGVIMAGAAGYLLGRLVLKMRAIYLSIATWAPSSRGSGPT